MLAVVLPRFIGCSRCGWEVSNVQLSEMPVAMLDEGAITRNTDEAYSVIIPSTRTAALTLTCSASTRISVNYET